MIVFSAIGGALGNGLVGYPSGEWFYHFLDPICHQTPTLSFWLFGHPLALCARCLGGYLGVFIGILLAKTISFRFGYLKTYAVAMTVFHVAVLEALIHPSDNNLWRSISGFLGGGGASVALFCLWMGASNLIAERYMKQHNANRNM